MNKQQYSAYLKAEHWQKVRLRKLRMAEHRCEHCKDDAILDVHHLTYTRLGRENDCDLIVLCRRCHTAIEEIIRDRNHSRRATPTSLRNYTHKRLRKAGIKQVISAQRATSFTTEQILTAQ